MKIRRGTDGDLKRQRESGGTARPGSVQQLLKFGVCLGAALVLSACSLVDLRTAETNGDAAAERGREIYARMIAKYGGRDRWLALKNTRAVFRDAWPSWFKRTMMMPWPEQNERTRWTALHGTDDARVDFLEGEWRGSSRGIQSGAVYHIDAQGATDFNADDDGFAFWLPAIQYLMELHYRLLEADVVRYAGRFELNDQSYERVFLSWGAQQPNEIFDQYIIYINTDTGLMDYAGFTIREMGGFMRGAIRYSDFREIDGLQTPFRYTLLDRVGGTDVFHDMILEELEYGVSLPADYVVRDPDRAGAQALSAK